MSIVDPIFFMGVEIDPISLNARRLGYQSSLVANRHVSAVVLIDKTNNYPSDRNE